MYENHATDLMLCLIDQQQIEPFPANYQTQSLVSPQPCSRPPACTCQS